MLNKHINNTKKIALTPKNICEMYGCNLGTLANLRAAKKGPRYYKVGSKIYYKKKDFEAWFFSEPVLTSDCC
ncbi:MAG: helix-turn-helix domain-containing protein [Proteobacteria bacterium]|nr:helix-turn-helix domain-containing protein [Pseudomonadota bacterium]